MTAGRTRWATSMLFPVGAVVAFNALLLRSELDPGSYPNDSSFHLAYLRWAAHRLSQGESPVDGIFPHLGLGFPVFEHYQVLPYLITAPFAWAFGAAGTYSFVLFVLLAGWPVCVYLAVRLLGLGRSIAAAAAVLAPFVMSVPGYGFEFGSYAWRGHGMWAQAWGMWLFALGLGLALRAIHQRRSLAVGALLLAALLTSHLLTGIAALAVLGTWSMLGPGSRRLAALRALALIGGAMLASAWLLVPSLVDSEATAYANPPDTFWQDSYGLTQVMS